MDDDVFKAVIAELIEANGQALALVVSAIASQGDATKLCEALRIQLVVAEKLLGKSTGVRIARYALAALDAESTPQSPAKH